MLFFNKKTTRLSLAKYQQTNILAPETQASSFLTPRHFFDPLFYPFSLHIMATFSSRFRHLFSSPSQCWDWVEQNKKSSFAALGALFVLIFFLLHAFIINGIFSANGANFSTEYRKVPFDIASLDITFNAPLQEGSGSSEWMKISPVTEGRVTIKNKNTLSFVLAKPLVVGKEYALEISAQTKSKDGRLLGQTLTYTFEAIKGARVSKLFPSGVLQELNKPILVLFNIPLIAAQSLDKQDELECPVVISPKVAGKCRWLSGNILEFRPNTPLNGATNYSVEVQNKPYFLYPLHTEAPATFSTQKLVLSINEKQSASKGILLYSNFALDAKALSDHISLSQDSLALEANIVAQDASSQVFIVNPKKGPLLYNTTYQVAIAKGLTVIGGNIPYEGNSKTISTLPLITQVASYKKIYSQTGTLIDTKSLPKNVLAIDNNQLFLDTGEQLNLNKNFFALKNSKGKDIDYTLSYGKTTTSEWDNFANKYNEKTTTNTGQLVANISQTLDKNETYTFVVKASAVGGLKNDEKTLFKTPKPFAISSFELKSNTEGCLYTTTPLFAENWDENNWFGSWSASGILSISPKATINQLMHNIPKYDPKFGCVKDGYWGYLVDMRLNTGTSYKLSVNSNLKDAYGNSLESTSPKTFTFASNKTVADKDKYVYIGTQKPINVVPQGAPLRVGIQTINTDKVYLHGCAMDANGYLDYVSHNQDANYEPKCSAQSGKWIDVKNKAWQLKNTSIELDKTLFGDKIADIHYLLVRGGLKESDIGYKHSEEEKKDIKRFESFFIRTNLSLALEKSGSGQSTLFASSLDGKSIPANLNFWAYNLATNKNIDLGIWWNEKKQSYTINYNDAFNAGGRVVIFAQNDAYFGVVNPETDLTSNYDFKYISGQSSSVKDFVYIYTDRPLYKRGDTVHFKGLWRQFGASGYTTPESKEVTIKILGSDMQTIREIKATSDKNGNLEGSFVLGDQMAFGSYTFEFWKSPDQSVYTNGNFYVDSYKKPVFKITLANPKNDIILGEKSDISINPSYYFGAPLASVKFEHTLRLQKYFFNPKEYSEFQFGENYENFACVYWGECSYNDSTVLSDSGSIDENGAGSISPDYTTGSGEVVYNHIFTINDPQSGRAVSNSISQIVHTTDAYVGLQADYYQTKKGAIVNGVVLNADAQPLNGKNVELTLTHKEWMDIKKQGVDGIFYQDYTLKENIEATATVISDSKGLWKTTMLPKTGGEYTLSAKYTGANGKSYVSSQDIYVDTDATTVWNNGNNSITEMSSDKSIYNVGETAKFVFRAPLKTGKLFVAIEKDDIIYDTFVQNVDNSTPVISLPIKPEYLPNVYIKAYFVGKNPTDLLPVYKRALSVVKVTTGNKKLTVKISTDKNVYKTGDKLGVQVLVLDEKGKGVPNANGSLSVVDESLLALTGNSPKNPFAFFYDMKRYLGIESMLSLSNLIEKLEVADSSLGEKGGAGDGNKGGDSKRKRGIFKDTAFWVGNFVTDKNGIWKTTLTSLPDNLTTWQLEALVNTADKMGVDTASISTQKQVVISENLPRFVAVGDKIVFAPSVYNKTGKDSFFAVSLSVGNSKAPFVQSVFIPNKSSLVVKFPVTIGASNSSSIVINMSAVANNSKLQDALVQTIPLQQNTITQTVAQAGEVEKDGTMLPFLLDNKIPNSLRISLYTSPYFALLGQPSATSSSLNEYLPSRVSTLLRYALQKSIAQSLNTPLDLKKIALEVYDTENKTTKKTNAQEQIENMLATLSQYQLPSGGFLPWIVQDVANQKADLATTSLITFALKDFADAGFGVNGDMWQKANNYILNRLASGKYEDCKINANPNCEYSNIDKLDALLSAAKNGASPRDISAPLDALHSAKEASQSEVAKLAAIYALLSSRQELSANYQDTINNLIKNALSNSLVLTSRGAYLGSDGNMSRVEGSAHLLFAFSALKPENAASLKDIANNMTQWLISQQNNSSFGSEKDTIIALDSLANSAKIKSVSEVNFSTKIKLNSQDQGGYVFNTNNRTTPYTLSWSGSQLAENNQVYIEKKGSGEAYYSTELTTTLTANNLPARDEGFFIENNYYNYNDWNKVKTVQENEWQKYLSGALRYSDLKYPNAVWNYISPTKNGKIGELLISRVRIISGEDRDHVTLNVPIPSGSELVNTNLKTEKNTLATSSFFDRQEYRDTQYFGYKDILYAGDYEQTFILRMTHEGIFNPLPASIFESAHPEVFGQSEGATYAFK